MPYKSVLILVFVEFTLRGVHLKLLNEQKNSLNPCFCGIYSQRKLKKHFFPNLKKS